MTWQHSPYTLPMAAVAAAVALVFGYAWRRRRSPGAPAFLVLCGALLGWTTLQALHQAGADLGTKLFFLRLQMLAVTVTPAAWLWLALLYTGRAEWLSRRFLAFLALEPLATQAVLWTNERHGWYWRRMFIDTSEGFVGLGREVGPYFWIHTGYSFLLLFAGSVAIAVATTRSPLVFRAQAQALLLALLAPWVVNILYIWDITPWPHLDPTPFALAVSCTALGFALFRYGLLDLLPVARDRVVEGMADGVLVLDGHDRLVDLNPAARALAGADVVGQPVALVLPALAERLQSGSLAEIESAGRTFEPRVSALERRGKAAGRLVVLRDVTERRRAEAALQRQNRYLEALLESSRVIASGLELQAVLRNIAQEGARLVGGVPGGIGLVREGQVVFEHVWSGGRWEDARLQVALGEGVAGRVAESGRAQIVNEVAAEGEAVAGEPLPAQRALGVLAVPIPGRSGPIAGVLTVCRAEGSPPFDEEAARLLEALARQAAVAIENAGLYGDLEDKKRRIAESLRAEQQLTRRLQELDTMKTNFMIVTAHELRTPITLLYGYLDALAQGLLGPATPAQERVFDVCRRTLARMVQSQEDIVAMLRMGQGALPLERRRLDLAALARSVVADFQPLLERRRQQASVEAESSAVEGDEGRLRQVLANLVQNAMKFTPDGGALRVQVGRHDREVEVAVQDEGVGLLAEELARVFDPFYAGSDPLHHHSGTFEFQARGVGLGLAIARGHVEAHQGRIWAESAGRGQGARFVFRLPAAAEDVDLEDVRTAG